LEAVTPRHTNIRDDERMQARAKFLESFRAIRGHVDQPSTAAEPRFERSPHSGIIVGDE
jgi:hypothetical protein